MILDEAGLAHPVGGPVIRVCGLAGERPLQIRVRRGITWVHAEARPTQCPSNRPPTSSRSRHPLFAAILDRVAPDLPYARIDIVADSDTGPVLMEAELIDPSLSLWAKAGAAAHLAQAVTTPWR